MDKTLCSLKFKRLIWTNCWNTRLERSGEVFAKAQFSLLWPWGHFRCRVITQRVLLRQSLPRLQPTTVKVCFLRNLENFNVTFVTTPALKIKKYIHVSSVHEGMKPFRCDICDFSSSHFSSMNRNVESVHEGKKPFKCNICDYSCSQKKGNKYICCICSWRKEATYIIPFHL